MYFHYKNENEKNTHNQTAWHENYISSGNVDAIIFAIPSTFGVKAPSLLSMLSSALCLRQLRTVVIPSATCGTLRDRWEHELSP